jgi:hypothetical protein
MPIHQQRYARRHPYRRAATRRPSRRMRRFALSRANVYLPLVIR